MPRFDPTPLAHSCRALTYAGALIGRAQGAQLFQRWPWRWRQRRQSARVERWYCSFKATEFSPGFVRHLEFVFDEGVCVRRADRQTSQLSVCRPINTYLTPGAKHSKHSFLECSAPMKHSAFECTKNSEHLSAFSTECSHTLKALGTQCWYDSGHSVLRTSTVCGMAARRCAQPRHKRLWPRPLA